MTREKWTVVVLEDDEHERRRLRLSSRGVRTAAIGALLLCLGLVGLTGLFVVKGADVFRTVQLERRNALLERELGSLRDRVASLQEEFDQLARRDAELRVLAGLDTIDPEVREAGIGGPGMPELESHPLYGLDRELGEESFAAAYDLSALERRARILEQSLLEAGDSLQAHRDLLESTPSILPTAGRLTSGFSSARPHPIHHRALPHEGVDVSAPRGTPILAAARGRVSFAGRRAGYGNVVELDHGYGYSTLYGHASQLMVRVGEDVERGHVIAQVGSTGIATSPHLHYEVRVGGRPMNPMNYIIQGAVP